MKPDQKDVWKHRLEGCMETQTRGIYASTD